MAFWSTLFSTKKNPDLPPLTIQSLRYQVYRSDCTAMRVLDRKNKTDFAIRPLADGLVEALVQEIGNTERVLTWDVVNALGKDDVWMLARTEAASKMTDVKTVDLDGGVQLLAANNFYLSAVLLHSFERARHTHGVLFAPVSWHHWVVHVIQAMTVPPTVALMKLAAENIQREMTVADYEALTGDLYWYKPNGSIAKLDVTGSGIDIRARSRELDKAIDDAFHQR
jgi:hypothetical protein